MKIIVKTWLTKALRWTLKKHIDSPFYKQSLPHYWLIYLTLSAAFVSFSFDILSSLSGEESVLRDKTRQRFLRY